MTSKEALELLTNCGTNIEDSDLENKVIEIYKKLVERDTPKKPIINIDNYNENIEHNCGVCVCRLDIPQLIEINFCPKCGQRIYWSNE